MQLPNPFAGSSSVKPAVRTEEFKSTINVGPGLPKAHSVDYGHFSATSNQSKSYGHGGFVRNFASLQNLPFSCERCNRSFKSQDLLSAHVSEHVTCGIDGCTFTAHPKIIQNHIQMQHETGLAAQIMRLNTPEEIEKWREERKRFEEAFTRLACFPNRSKFRHPGSSRRRPTWLVARRSWRRRS